MKDNKQPYIMFHGSIEELESFSEDKIGKGGDPNSALGIHVTEIPSIAYEYASMQSTLEQKEPKLYIVEIDFNKEDFISSSEDFYGCDDEDTHHHEHFKILRKEYMESNIDIVHFEGGEEPSSIVMSPKKAKIIQCINGKDNIKEFVEKFEENFIAYDDYETRQKVIDNFKPKDTYKKRKIRPK